MNTKYTRVIKNYPDLLINITILLIAFFFAGNRVFSQTTSPTIIPPGSFIINMGIVPQTVNNGLRPYGLVYELLQAHCPVDWIINTSKEKDGADFSYMGYNFKGGTFIVEAGYRTTAINAIIERWAPANNTGVVGITTTIPVVVPLYLTFWSPPRWVMDRENGALAVNFFSYAGIPASAYGGAQANWKTPAQLDDCDDIFVLPHAEPTWATHGYLFDWIKGTGSGNTSGSKGSLWLGCNAGSALMDMFNNVTPDYNQQTNFLVDKSGPAFGAGPYCENALLLWSNHADGTPPFTYDYSGEPVMQFMGTIDAAQQGGWEKIYIPYGGAEGWHPATHAAVYDPNHPDRYNLTNKKEYRAASLVYGPGMGIQGNGNVMLEGGHNISGTAPSNIAAQRAFFNFSFWMGWKKAFVPSLINLPDTIVSRRSYALSYTATPNELPGIAQSYTTIWSSSCDGTWFPDHKSKSPAFTPSAVSVKTLCNITVEITDNCGRKSFDTHSTIILPCTLKVTAAITAPVCEGDTNGSIKLDVTGGTSPFNWTIAQNVSQPVIKTGSGTTISGLSEGSYTYRIADNDGCVSGGDGNIVISAQSPLPAKPTVALINQPSCAVNLGSILLNGLPASGSWTITRNPGGYLTTGTGTSMTVSDLTEGTYNWTVTNSAGCVSLATTNILMNRPPSKPLLPVISEIIHPNCTLSTGTIKLSMQSGSGITYSIDGISYTNTTGLFTLVPSGNYTLTARSADGCISSGTGVEINPRPDCIPIALNDTGNGKADQPLSGDVSLNDVPVRDLVSTWTLVGNNGGAVNGKVVMDVHGAYTYTPDVDFTGSDSFRYQVCSKGIIMECSAASVTVNIARDENCAVFVPNSFSPNGDGVHDNFKIKCLYNFENPTIEIYNRWGKLIFSKDHYGDTDYWGSETDAWWNGRAERGLSIGNQQLPAGTYYYLLKLDQSKVLKGFLFLNK